jgi:hypothetical protein
MNFGIGDTVTYKDDSKNKAFAKYNGQRAVVAQFYPNLDRKPPYPVCHGHDKDGIPYTYDIQFVDNSIHPKAAWLVAKEKELTLVERAKPKRKDLSGNYS